MITTFCPKCHRPYDVSLGECPVCSRKAAAEQNQAKARKKYRWWASAVILPPSRPKNISPQRRPNGISHRRKRRIRMLR